MELAWPDLLAGRVPGERIGIVSVNGAGKSTPVRVLTGANRPIRIGEANRFWNVKPFLRLSQFPFDLSSPSCPPRDGGIEPGRARGSD